PVLETLDARQSNERNTPALMGVGLIELLAREMSGELGAAREAARAEAQVSGAPARRELRANGVSFGAVTVLPDGRVDPREIEGVDWDLVVRPFHQKGAAASLRDFTNTALNHHHGIQTVERAGAGIDLDGDGVRDELTVGDVTALVFFQAALDTPGRLLPSHPAQREAAARGELLFASVGCAGCHLPVLELADPRFTEPGPYNPRGNLRREEVRRPAVLDLARDGIGPRPERRPDGRVLVRAFTDLKRHDLNDAELRHFANEQVAQGTLAGVLQSSAFTEVPKARPRSQFLTRRLWDVGNTDPYGHRGDLTTLTQAIHFHGGEARAARDAYFALPEGDRAAVIEFLKSLQILPASE
ncbi:MAG TPA: di-heme oxidoredictase family protein, partial [Thermoanaerobaculia bacterium]